MNLLILSYYFPPDLSAGAFRTGALVTALGSRLPAGSTVTVLTTEPNRYGRTADQPAEHSVQTGDGLVTIKVVRFRVAPHKNRLLLQVKGFFGYSLQVLRWLRQQNRAGSRFDRVFATSSRLQTGFLGAVVARLYQLRFFLELRDLFVENLQEIFPPMQRFFLLPIFRAMESWTVGRAERLVVVSPAFAAHYSKPYPRLPILTIENGVDPEFLAADFAKQPPPVGSPIQVLYAGNIGEGQGLERILPKLARARLFSHQFLIIGDGGRGLALAEAVQQLPNVRFLPPLPRSELHLYYRTADILFLHLNDYESFKSVIPSKIFEYAATGKPIVAGVAGISATILRGVPGAVVFEPCNLEGGLKAIDLTSRALHDYRGARAAFLARYDRGSLIARLADVVAGD
ncbi:MAG: glycosyltransferase family 4 protein [Alphaproteobacteria bacterium]|nr:glycosyltransferase family 4 protein [Alphaproteobacteria bacterium]